MIEKITELRGSSFNIRDNDDIYDVLEELILKINEIVEVINEKRPQN